MSQLHDSYDIYTNLQPYYDFYVVSYDEAQEQYEAAKLIVKDVQKFLKIICCSLK